MVQKAVFAERGSIGLGLGNKSLQISVMGEMLEALSAEIQTLLSRCLELPCYRPSH